LGSKPVTNDVHWSIEAPVLVNVVTTTESTAWFVGGELKLFIEKLSADPAGKIALTTFDKVTSALA